MNKEALAQAVANRTGMPKGAALESIDAVFESIREAYLARFPYIGQPVTIRYGAQEAAGTVQTISPRGTLLLQTPQGVTEISIGDMMV